MRGAGAKRLALGCPPPRASAPKQEHCRAVRGRKRRQRLLSPPCLASTAGWQKRSLTSPWLRMSCAMAVVLPPGAAHMSSTRDPGAGASTCATRRLGRFCSIS